MSAHLVNETLADELSDLLDDFAFPPRMLVIEITESAVMDDPVAATRALDRLATVGIGGVAIDDFGTGHSSLGRLRDLPIDALKIDRSFVAELDRGVNPAFVRSVIDLGHYLGLRVVAEGVEDQKTWRHLARLGCDVGQGYWLSPPLPAADVTTWLAEHDVDALAAHGLVGERRGGTDRRGLERIAHAFDRAPEAMLLSDRAHRWVAINAAARSLLRIRPGALIEQHVDDTTRTETGVLLTTRLGVLGGQRRALGRLTSRSRTGRDKPWATSYAAASFPTTTCGCSIRRDGRGIFAESRRSQRFMPEEAPHLARISTDAGSPPECYRVHRAKSRQG